MPFKYADWQPNTSPVSEDDRAFDPCAPITEEESFVMLNKLNIDMIERRKEDIDAAYKIYAEEAKLNKQDPKYMPKCITVRLGQCGIKINLQRQQEEDHQIRIMATWDFRRLTTARGAWDPMHNAYGITEGQQRLSALRNKIMRGDLKEYGWDINNWEDFPINLEMINLEVVKGITDYGPECKTYIQENSEKLPMTHADKLKAEVMAKVKYSPNKKTYPEFEQAGKVYTLMKEFGITAHNKESEHAAKAGACTQIKFFRNDKRKNTALPLSDLRKIFELHDNNSRHDPLISIEFLPMLTFLKWVNIDESDDVKVAELQKVLRYMNAIVHESFDGWQTYMNFAEKIWGKMHPGQGSPHKDWSLIFLLQLVKKAGYTYPDDIIHPKTNQNIYTMFDKPTGWSKMTPAERSRVL